jgi:1-acyl-sn-glycerol-3-phosphate acyltransferase
LKSSQTTGSPGAGQSFTSSTAPEPRPRVDARLWSLLVVSPLIVLSTLFFGTVSALVWLFRGGERRQIEVARKWARSLLFFAGVKVDVEGLEKIDLEGHYVFASNHLSYMDTPVVFTHIPVQFRFLAKKGLFQIPFLGWHLTTAGHVPVPREDPRASLRTLSRAAELIRERGISVLIFPEGGRSLEGDLQEFKDGAAYIAIKAQTPLVPLALIGTREVLPMGSGTFHRGLVRLRVGDPIPTEGLTLHDRRRVTDAAREQVAAMLGVADARLP